MATFKNSKCRAQNSAQLSHEEKNELHEKSKNETLEKQN